MNELGLLPGLMTIMGLTLLGLGLVAVTRRHAGELSFQMRLFLIAIILRFALSLIVYCFGLVDVIGDEDGSGWILGVGLADKWSRAGSGFVDLPYILAEAFDKHNLGYFYLLGSYFFVIGEPSRMAAAALNCFFGALTVVFAYRIARTLFSQWVAQKVGWWTCIFPSLIIWSATTVKEPVVILLETLALYGCVRIRENALSIPHLLLCGATIVLLIPFRFYAAYLVAGAVLFSLLAPTLFQPKSGAAAVVLVLVLLPVIGGTGFFARHVATFESFDLDRIQAIRSDLATGADAGGSSVATMDVRTPLGLVTGGTIGAAHLLLAPFPWQLGASMRAFLTLPELIFWWWLFCVGFVPGLWYCLRRRFAEVRAILMLLLGFGLLYSLTFGNVGLIYRQRAQLLPWLFVFAAVGLERRALKKQGLLVEETLPPQPELVLTPYSTAPGVSAFPGWPPGTFPR